MKYIKQLAIILSILYFSNFISDLISNFFLLPGPILGMIILFILLKLKWLKIEQIENLSIFMFSIIAMFFLPSGISIMNYLDLIRNNFIPIIFIGVIVTIISLAITMKSIDLLANIRSRRQSNHD